MSGLEAIAVIGVVAALVTAFKDSSTIANSIKQRRKNKEGALPPTDELEEALAEGEHEIQKAAAVGIRKFGPAFVEEDREFRFHQAQKPLLMNAVEAKVALQTVVIEVQASLLRDLTLAVQDDSVTDFSDVIDASTEARMKAVNILTGLYLRKKQQVSSPVVGQQHSILEAPARVNQQPQSPSPQKSQPIPVPARPQVPVQPMRSKDTENNQRKPKNSRRVEATPEPTHSSWKRKLSGWTQSYVDERISKGSPPKRTEHATEPALQYPASMSSTLGRTPPPYQLSPSQTRADPSNPWVEAQSMTDSDSRQSIHSTQSQHLNRQDTHFSTQSTTISPGNAFGGFCEGAYHLQVGLPESALKRKNDSVSMTGQGQYFACRGKRCAFEGPAILYERGWSHDRNLRTRPGLEYRWMFLAKSHVPQSRVRNKLYDFRCLICVLLGDDSSIFHGANDLLEHVAGHAGSQMTGITLTGPLVIGNNSIVQATDENFDISFPTLRTLSLSENLSSSPTSIPISSDDVVSVNDPYDAMSTFNPHWR